jgi:hypothetical protein
MDMATTKQTFGTTQEVREYLVSLGFAPFKKGLVKGEFSIPGKKASFGMGLISKTGQSSMGAAAQWAFNVTVEE